MPSSKDPVINRQKAREWRLANPDKHREANKLWARKKRLTNPELVKVINKRYRDSRTSEQREKKAIYQRQWLEDHPDYARIKQQEDHNLYPGKRMVEGAKHRAVGLGVPFDLKWRDIVIPEACPVLGITLVGGLGASHPSSPSLDRLIPAEGYVFSNVRVISQAANSIKKNKTIEEMETYVEEVAAHLDAAQAVLAYMRREIGEQKLIQKNPVSAAAQLAFGW